MSTPMKKNIVGSEWDSFWPNTPTSTSTPYAGDIVASKASVNSVPITSIALTLSSPLNEFGFVALPEDAGNMYDLTVTLLAADGGFITSENAIIGPGATCGQGNLPGDPSGTPSPCGFFGYT